MWRVKTAENGFQFLGDESENCLGFVCGSDLPRGKPGMGFG